MTVVRAGMLMPAARVPAQEDSYNRAGCACVCACSEQLAAEVASGTSKSRSCRCSVAQWAKHMK